MNSQNIKPEQTAVNSVQTEFGARFKLLLITRFILFVLLFFALIFSRPQDSDVSILFLVYGATTLGYFFASLIKQRRKQPVFLSSFRFIAGLSLSIEVIIEIVIIHISGGIYSPYLFLIALTIITASFIYKLGGTLIVTSIASVLYSVLILAEYHNWILISQGFSRWHTLYADGDALFFSTYIFVCFLYIVAFLSGYISNKLLSQYERIEHLDNEISALRISIEEIIDHLNDGVIQLDPSNRITYINPSAKKIFNLDKTPAGKNNALSIETNLPVLLPVLKEFETAIDRASFRREINLSRTGGQPVLLRVNVNSIEINGIPVGKAIVMEDYTSEKHKLIVSEQMKKLSVIADISARFAHEIRNPLASIRGSVEMLMGNIELHPEDQRLFELVIKESDRLTKLLEDFLVFARIRELPEDQFSSGIVDVGEIMDDVVMLIMSHPSYRREIEIKNSIFRGTVKVQGQPDQLTKAFFNIMLNACQAIGENSGLISIRLAPEKNNLFSPEASVGIIISDSGRGMDETEIENIFTPFVSNRKSGVGLGMAITQSVVTKHGGYIEIESKPGKGTSFIINLRPAKINDAILEVR